MLLTTQKKGIFMNVKHYFLALFFAVAKMNAWSEVEQNWEHDCHAIYYETPYRVLSNRMQQDTHLNRCGHNMESDGSLRQWVSSEVNDTLVIHSNIRSYMSGVDIYTITILNNAVKRWIFQGTTSIPNQHNQSPTLIQSGVVKSKMQLAEPLFWAHPMDRSLSKTGTPPNPIISIGSNKNCYAGVTQTTPTF